jgi:Raf kinase inhibitor-like YbhB/YbcL family protein
MARAVEEASPMKITSNAFASGGEIPGKYTCTGGDVSPPLAWSGAPQGTVSFALIVDDPDAPDPAAPKRTWVHWVLYNLAPREDSLAEGAGNRPVSPPARAGLNDWSRPGYGGPCPPIGRHRYFFKLYALDAQLPESDTTGKAAVEKAMQGHVLAQAEIVGTFQK